MSLGSSSEHKRLWMSRESPKHRLKAQGALEGKESRGDDVLTELELRS